MHFYWDINEAETDRTFPHRMHYIHLYRNSYFLVYVLLRILSVEKNKLNAAMKGVKVRRDHEFDETNCD